MPEIHEGRCLCGAVCYQTQGDPIEVGVCHCTNCRRRTGSAFGIGAYFAKEAVEITMGAPKAYEYHSDETGHWLRMEFCSECGTTVTWTAEFVPDQRAIAVGTLDDPNWLKPRWHVWTRSALRWVTLPTDVELDETDSLVR